MAEETVFLNADGKPLPASLRASGGTLTILASSGNRKRFKALAYSGGPLTGLKGYDHPVIVDLAGVEITAQNLPTPHNHDESNVIGNTDSITITAQGIEATGELDTGTSDGLLVHAAGKGGLAWEMSIGAPVQAMEFYKPGESVVVNGRSHRGPVYIARKTSLREISFVRKGADLGRTHVAIAASLGKGKPMFETWIKAQGFDVESLSDAQKSTLMNAYVAASAPVAKPVKKIKAEGDEEDEEEEMELDEEGNPIPKKKKEPIAAAAEVRALREELKRDRAERAEQTRVLAINAKCSAHPEIQAKAIAEKWTADKAELEVLRAGRPEAFNIIIPAGQTRQSELQSLQAAMILRAGGRLDHPGYASIHASASPAMPAWIRASINDDTRQRVMERAHRIAAINSIDLCRRCVAIDGKQVPEDMPSLIRAAFSGSSFSNVFTTSIYARMIAGFTEAPDTTESWTQAEDVTDFKLNDEIRILTLGGVPQKLPRGGTAEHISRSDEVESYKIDRYAAQFVADEQDVIDDRLGAIAQNAPDMGMWFRSIPQDIVYGILLENPTLGATALSLFSDSNSPDNLRASSALTDTNLKAAIPQMMLARENSRNINVMPTHILVPPSLMFTAATILNSALMVSGASTPVGNANVLQGMLQIVREPRLENGVTNPDSGTTSSGSATSWYLASTSPGLRTIKRLYRTGTGRAPQIRDFNLSEGRWGKGWDICFDCGAAPLDFRGLQKNNS